MPNIIIDNQPVSVEPGVTILEAAAKLGIKIPTLCYLPGHCATTSCMVCVVKINGGSKLAPSCATRVVDGMVVESESEDVRAARKMALELLLGDHLGDCVGPCHVTCPAHMNIPLMISHLAAGRNREAIAVIKEHIALPASLGRVCPEICEKACRRSSVDKAVSICKLKRFAADTDLASGAPYMPKIKPSIGKRVAIIGAGPAGLAAAYYLLREGVACTVFDKNPLPGGALRREVPAEKLPREVIDAEVGIIQSMGAEFKMEVSVQVPDIRRDFDAVLIATGSGPVKVDKHTMMTSEPGIFAAGSVVTPYKHAVRAVADGRAAALSIVAYLAKQDLHNHARPYTVRIGKLLPDELQVFAADASASTRVKPEDAFNPAQAADESARCLHCECAALDDCKLRDHAIEYSADPGAFKSDRRHFVRDSSHPHLVHEPGKCISCGICAAVAEEAGEPLGLAFIGRGYDVQLKVPFGEPLSEGLQESAKRCAKACPTGALVVKGT